MHEFEKDAVAPLGGSTFEPKTPFLYQGVMHNPAVEGSAVNRGRPGNGADFIEVTHTIVMSEIELGLHPNTGRPISGLLNHCTVAHASPENRQALMDFYATVKKRKSARRRRRVKTKKEEATRTEVTEESFGEADGKAAASADGDNSRPTVEKKAPAKKKTTRKKAKRKAK